MSLLRSDNVVGKGSTASDARRLCRVPSPKTIGLNVDVHGFGLVALLQAIWLVWAGCLLMRVGNQSTVEVTNDER